MCAGFNNFAFIEHYKGIKIEKSKNAVGNNDGCFMLKVYTQVTQDLFFGTGINSA